MSSLDAIRPPKKRKKDNSVPQPKSPPVTKTVKSPPPRTNGKERKYRLMWLLVATSAIIIIIGWVLLYEGGQLTTSGQSGYLKQFNDKVGSIWESFKTNILKLQKSIEDTNISTEEERIKKLEEKVFPQFEDPSRQ